MSFYVFNETIPYTRKANLVVYNRDIGHENNKIRSDDRVLALSSRKTYEMALGGMIKKIEEMKSSMYERDVLLTDVKIKDKQSFKDYYSRILKYVESRKFESVEIPFIYKEDNSGEYLEILGDLIQRYLDKRELSIGIYITEKAFIENNLQTLVKYGAYISRNNYHRSIPDVDHYRPRLAMRMQPHPASAPKLNNDFVEGCYYSVIHKPEEDFHDKLFRYLEKSKKSNVEVYTDGSISRQVFSNAITKGSKLPKKNTIICLIIGMELCLDDALDLLNSAGFTLSNTIFLDRTIKNFISKGNFNIEEINRILDDNGEPIIGWNPR